MPLLARIADRMPVDVREPAHQRVAVQRLELVQPRAVDDPGDHLAHVVGVPRVVGHDAVAARPGRMRRAAASTTSHAQIARRVQVGDHLADDPQGVLVVQRVVIGDAGLPRVHVGAAQLLGRDVLAGRRLHQRRAAEEDRAGAA